MKETKTARLYAISIFADREETLLGESAITSYHAPAILGAPSPEEAEAEGLRIAKEGWPESEGWRHHVSVVPYDVTTKVTPDPDGRTHHVDVTIKRVPAAGEGGQGGDPEWPDLIML